MAVANLLKLAMKGPPPLEEVEVLNLEGKPVKRIKLPEIFKTPIRPDLIQRAFLAAFTAKIQPQGRDPMAGKRTTAQSWGVGYGVARVPRVKGLRRAAFAPMTVGGRRAHPPRVEEVVREKINRKERVLAIKSAISATAIKELVKLRGHKLPPNLNLPIVVSSEIEELRRTYDAKKLLMSIGVWEDLLRAKRGIKIRAGKGKMRGRRYKEPKSVLVVLAEDKGARKAFENLPGVDVTTVDRLSIIHLAPGATPGRLTVWSENAITRLAERFKEAA